MLSGKKMQNALGKKCGWRKDSLKQIIMHLDMNEIGIDSFATASTINVLLHPRGSKSKKKKEKNQLACLDQVQVFFFMKIMKASKTK
jgi:hypothetical protein